jgi:hypothetical protein
MAAPFQFRPSGDANGRAKLCNLNCFEPGVRISSCEGNLLRLKLYRHAQSDALDFLIIGFEQLEPFAEVLGSLSWGIVP